MCLTVVLSVQIGATLPTPKPPRLPHRAQGGVRAVWPPV
jgi:hypothetical protein